MFKKQQLIILIGAVASGFPNLTIWKCLFSTIVYIERCILHIHWTSPLHFLLNLLVNADVCFVKAFKSPNKTIWIQRSPLELSIMDDHSVEFRPLLASDRPHHHDQRWAFPYPGRVGHYSRAHKPNGHSLLVADRLYLPTDKRKKK